MGNGTTLVQAFASCLLVLLVATVYGIIHAFILAQITPDYFNGIAEPARDALVWRYLGMYRDSPVVIAITCGIRATWHFGLICGCLVAIASHAPWNVPRLPPQKLVWPLIAEFLCQMVLLIITLHVHTKYLLQGVHTLQVSSVRHPPRDVQLLILLACMRHTETLAYIMGTVYACILLGYIVGYRWKSHSRKKRSEAEENKPLVRESA